MRYFLLVVVFTFTLWGDEIQRIESIVKDIEELRKQYDASLEQHQKDSEKIKQYEQVIKSLKIKIKNQEKLLKNKENKNKKTVKTKKCIYEIKKNDNKFPNLVMKHTQKDSTVQIEYFTASAFRLRHDAPIYNDVKGSVIATWEAKTSFTSNQRFGKWIKITGYFTNRVWHSAEKELWVHSEDVIKRQK